MALSSPHVSPPPADAVTPPPPRLDRGAAVQAGIGLLLIAVLGAFGYVAVVQGLVTEGDAARTAADINGSRGLFAIGVAALYAAALLDVVVAWALFRFFEPVDAQLARLSAYLRVAYTAVFLAALGQLAGVPALLDQGSGAFSTEQLQAQALGRIETYHDVWFAGLVLFGAHLAVLGLLVLRVRPMPRVLGALLFVAGAGYAFDTFHDVLLPGSQFPVTTVTFFGEFLLALWLVARAGRAIRGGGSR
jgi:hypothetical protein